MNDDINKFLSSLLDGKPDVVYPALHSLSSCSHLYAEVCHEIESYEDTKIQIKILEALNDCFQKHIMIRFDRFSICTIIPSLLWCHHVKSYNSNSSIFHIINSIILSLHNTGEIHEAIINFRKIDLSPNAVRFDKQPVDIETPVGIPCNYNNELHPHSTYYQLTNQTPASPFMDLKTYCELYEDLLYPATHIKPQQRFLYYYGMMVYFRMNINKISSDSVLISMCHALCCFARCGYSHIYFKDNNPLLSKEMATFLAGNDLPRAPIFNKFVTESAAFLLFTMYRIPNEAILCAHDLRVVATHRVLPAGLLAIESFLELYKQLFNNKFSYSWNPFSLKVNNMENNPN